MLSRQSEERTARRGGRRAETGSAACRRVVALVGASAGVGVSDILAPTRSRAAVAAARQLAMYLCHTLLSLSMTEVGRYFGRDRTTVAHACALVEDLRDDGDADARIARIEEAVMGWLRGTGTDAGE